MQKLQGDYINYLPFIAYPLKHNYLVKPILLFLTELLEHESKEGSSKAEKLFYKLCKHLLGVHKNTTIIAIHGEIGTYPLHIDTKK